MATKLIELEEDILVEVEVPENQVQQISGGLADRVDATFEKIKPILIGISRHFSYDKWCIISGFIGVNIK